VLLVAGGLAALRWTRLGDFLDREVLVESLEALRHTWWAPLALLGLYVVLPPIGFPSTPLMAAGAIIFGVVWGSVYNFVGSVLGAAACFFLARGLGRGLVLYFFAKPLQRFEKILDRHGLWAIVRLRFLPVPFPIMSYGPALVGIRPGVFLLGTTIGCLLPIPIWTYFWGTIFGAAAGEAAAAGRNVVLALFLFLLLSFVPRMVITYRRRGRYRQILKRRSERP
jgi:uncharacterized membrane protein YdjX (TVP38/TMEM64 family)